jgi:hypothetical protein
LRQLDLDFVHLEQNKIKLENNKKKGKPKVLKNKNTSPIDSQVTNQTINN